MDNIELLAKIGLLTMENDRITAHAEALGRGNDKMVAELQKRMTPEEAEDFGLPPAPPVAEEPSIDG